MRRKRRNHKPEFKAKVALAAISCELTMAELTKKFDLHPNQIQDRKKQLLDFAPQGFGKGVTQSEDNEAEVHSLRGKIGELTMENDFLERGLTKIHGPRGKKW